MSEKSHTLVHCLASVRDTPRVSQPPEEVLDTCRVRDLGASGAGRVSRLLASMAILKKEAALGRATLDVRVLRPWERRSCARILFGEFCGRCRFCRCGMFRRCGVGVVMRALG